ncbi:MAG: PQQ-dependent sugar dehydrogenase [Bryobacteraceae bacterium]
MRKLVLFALLLGVAAVAQDPEVRLVRVASGLSNPISIQSPLDGSGRLFFVQQNGLIRFSRNGALAATPFLDIRGKTRASGECGLLGLAFPPGYSQKRYFYVNYTNPACNTSVVARYRLSANADLADADSEEVILTQAQPFSNHNGGDLAFGPDGFLYIGFGDGGSGGDPQNNSQNFETWLGKMLRIDTESGRTPYAVPPSNPFAGDARRRPEIWALGLRNPWRYSFDRETGELWIGDVGQNRVEEINLQSNLSKGGENYGWRVMEGASCFNPPQNCDRNGLTAPVLEYTRGQGDVSVTGGYVYRGVSFPSLRGTYVYGDYASGRIWGIRKQGTRFENRLLLDSDLNISTFGEDEAGELYVAHHGRGEIFRIESIGPPNFTARSVTNAASFEAGLTPGSAAALFVSGVRSLPGITAARALPLPRELEGVKVMVNSREAPLFAVANINGLEQVNFQTPWETEGPVARVSVVRDGKASPEVDVPVMDLQPAIFEGTGGEAVIVRSGDNTLVTPQRPMRPGELVYFYATGLGPVDANPGNGNGGPSNPLARARSAPSVLIDGVQAEVIFAGLAPAFAGVYQVNIRVPPSVRSGQREMALSVGTVRGKTVRISVE